MYVRMKPEDRNLANSQWHDLSSATDVAKFVKSLIQWAWDNRRSWTSSKGQTTCGCPPITLEFSNELKVAF